MIAWLIEKQDKIHPENPTGEVLGISNKGKVEGLNTMVGWTIPISDSAIRFARKIDAENMAQFLVPDIKTIAVEHSWD